MIKQIYKDIKQVLKEKITAIRWIDFDIGQLNYEGWKPVSHPFALVDFPGITFSNASEQRQLGSVQVVLTVGFKVYEATHGNVPAINEEKGLEHLDVIGDIYQALHGKEGDSYSPLVRITERRLSRADYRVYQLVFMTNFDDRSDMVSKEAPETMPSFKLTPA